MLLPLERITLILSQLALLLPSLSLASPGLTIGGDLDLVSGDLDLVFDLSLATTFVCVGTGGDSVSLEYNTRSEK